MLQIVTKRGALNPMTLEPKVDFINLFELTFFCIDYGFVYSNAKCAYPLQQICNVLVN